EACTCGKLSRKRRAAARTRRYMFAPLYCWIHFSSSVLPGLNDHGTNAVKPPNISRSSRLASKRYRSASTVSPSPYIMGADDLDTRRGASRMTPTHAYGPAVLGP